MTVSDIKSERIWHHVSSKILERMTQDQQVRCITVYFDVLHVYKRFCCIRYTARTNSAYYCISYMWTHTNHVWDCITLNYTSMTNWVGIYSGTVAFYRDLTRMTVSDIKSEWIWHDSSDNNTKKNDTAQTATMHYGIFRRFTRLQTVRLHSIHCKYEFRILKYIIFVDTYQSRLWLYYT